ncbi:MAG: hypothetical protein Q4B89_07990 [Lachnospiraceae bacterium]|nr:hypothetical protein [Lachnospiraceae bacterium]
MFDMYQEGIKVCCLLDEDCCKLDARRRSTLELKECPNGNEFCTGDCVYYSENLEDKCCEYLEPDEHGGICHAGDDVECPEGF